MIRDCRVEIVFVSQALVASCPLWNRPLPITLNSFLVFTSRKKKKTSFEFEFAIFGTTYVTDIKSALDGWFVGPHVNKHIVLILQGNTSLQYDEH